MLLDHNHPTPLPSDNYPNCPSQFIETLPTFSAVAELEARIAAIVREDDNDWMWDNLVGLQSGLAKSASGYCSKIDPNQCLDRLLASLFLGRKDRGVEYDDDFLINAEIDLLLVATIAIARQAGYELAADWPKPELVWQALLDGEIITRIDRSDTPIELDTSDDQAGQTKFDALAWIQAADKVGLDPILIDHQDGTDSIYMSDASFIESGVETRYLHEDAPAICSALMALGRVAVAPATLPIAE